MIIGSHFGFLQAFPCTCPLPCRIMAERLNSRVTQLAAAEHAALQQAAAARQEAEQAAAEARLRDMLPELPAAAAR